MYVLVVREFTMKATLYQPAYDDCPSMGCVSAEQTRKFEKGEIIEVGPNFHPVKELTDRCASVHGGLLQFNQPVPMHKVIVISDKNRKMAMAYAWLQSASREVEKELMQSVQVANDAGAALHEAESIEDVVEFFKGYSRNVADAAERQMALDTLLAQIKGCEDGLKRSQRIAVIRR